MASPDPPVFRLEPYSNDRESRAAGYSPLEGTQWTAETRSEEMKKLVDKREQVFAALRRLDIPHLVTRNLEELNRCDWVDNTEVRWNFDRYREFCTTLDIPFLPLTPSTIALYFVAKCSWKNGHYRTNERTLRRMLEVVHSIWQDEQDYEHVESFADAELALREFQAERVGIRVRSGASQPPNPKNAQADGDVEEEEEEEDQGDSSDSRDESSSSSDEWVPRKRKTLDGAEGQEENSGSFNEVGGGNGSSAFARQQVQQVVVPKLPRDRQAFSSKDELYLACYEALLPVYGMGAQTQCFPSSKELPSSCTIHCARNSSVYTTTPEGRCRWTLVAILDKTAKRLVVDYSQSDLYHNHLPHPSILRDPTWKPLVRDAEMRRRLGMAPLASRKLRKKLKPNSVNVQQSQISIPSTSARAIQTSDQPFAFPGPSISTSISSSTVVNLNPQIYPSPSVSLPRVASSPSFILYQSNPDPSLKEVSVSSSSAAFFPHLTSFLIALDPSLAPLASIFVKMGFDSHELLSQLCSLETATLRRLSKATIAGTREGGGEGGGKHVTRLFELFAIKVVLARESDYQ